MLTRRSFLGWLATVVPAGAIVRSAEHLAAAEIQGPAANLRALAAAVLPDELGTVGVDAEVRGFQRWIAEYRENAEVNHAYGSSRLRFLGPTPATRWMRQLDELDTRARTLHGRGFASLSLDARRALVRETIAQDRAASIADVGGASHVALAVLAHFYSGRTATDLCYRAAIGKQSCRPLARAKDRPTPLRRSASAGARSVAAPPDHPRPDLRLI